MLKLLGCALTVICAALWGFEKSADVKKEAEFTFAVMGLVKRTGEEIATLCCPLPDIFSSYNDEILSESGFMNEVRTAGFSDALKNHKNSFPPSVLEILEPFAKRLGAGDREEQTALCKRTYMHLCDEYEKISEKLPERTKMIKVMPPLCVLCAVILII